MLLILIKYFNPLPLLYITFPEQLKKYLIKSRIFETILIKSYRVETPATYWRSVVEKYFSVLAMSTPVGWGLRLLDTR